MPDRKSELPAAVVVPCRLLVGVPGLLGSPARRFGIEPQDRRLSHRPGEDTEGLVEMLADLFRRQIQRIVLEHVHIADTLQRKTSQTLGKMTPGGQVPAITVGDQPLW